MKKIRRMSQTADLAATIHSAYSTGASIGAAMDKARSRYPGLSGTAVATIAQKIYAQRSVVEEYFSGNMGALSNAPKAFGCTGNSIRFTTYSTFIDKHSGLPKEFWVDTVVTFEQAVIHKSDLVWFLYNEGVNRARQLGYDPNPLIPGATASSLVQSGVLKITGFSCID